ncbi:fungal-specific transcription factor domain-containing protein [Fusarium redolens]|uniref:Fungal-specific transcription factor domain-containing protein n=1 Tax=Fusarium redolens TaxID=48865 RepID=A0A9P9G3F3_FUSRE|nr:fungal-specific transcription factor domain-containing protein [Fusarium redolens]KAH7230679.1 fungal-specific transcription factor domain-containing protein [Fusarium redolens]
MARTGTCWTCRLRRKKCDQKQPACQSCSALNIRCHYSTERPDWMDGGEKQDEMTRCFKAQVKQGKERQRERDYIQVLNIGGDAKPLPVAATADSWTFDGIPAVNAFKELDVDFTMLYVDQVFPFLFPYYAPPMIQGGRAWVLGILRHNKTLFHAVMSLSTFFFTLILSSEDVSGHQVCRQNVWTQLEGYANTAIKSLQNEVLAINQQGSSTLLQQSRAMESITQLMVLEMAMAKTSALSMHLGAAISLLEDILEPSKLNDKIDIRRAMAELERPSWVPLTTERPVWNTEQAALRFFFAILLWADIVSSTSLQTVPRLRKYYPNLICHEYGGATTEPLLRMEEYMGCEGWALIAIAETAALDVWKREEQANGTLAAEDLANRGDQLDGALQQGLKGLDGRCREREREPRRILQNFYLSSDANQSAKQAAATRIWAYASRIYLAVVTHGWQPHLPAIRESAGEVLSLLQQHENPAILRSSVWPFCVAGCVADASQEKEFRDLAAGLGSLQSFGLVGESLRILEHVWSRRGELNLEWNLAACFSIMGSPVLLL